MRTISILLAIFLVLFAFENAAGQKQSNVNNEQFYWLNISIKTVLDKEFKNPVIQVDRVYKKVYSGSLVEFAEAYKQNLKKKKLSVGPFSSKKLVLDAQRYYKMSDADLIEGSEEINKMKPNSEIYYFYYTEPLYTDNSKSLIFSRIPAAIASGTNLVFVEIFNVGKFFHKLVIGPFDNLLNAEKSKYISRKYGETGSEGSENDNKAPLELQNMAENWKSLKKDILDPQFNEAKDSVTIQLKIDFPTNYFEGNTTQVITFGYANKDTTYTFSDGITLQGESFRDNNKIISYDVGGSVSYFAKIPYSATKNSKILVKSTLFGGVDLLKCEDVLLNIEL